MATKKKTEKLHPNARSLHISIEFTQKIKIKSSFIHCALSVNWTTKQKPVGISFSPFQMSQQSGARKKKVDKSP